VRRAGPLLLAALCGAGAAVGAGGARGQPAREGPPREPSRGFRREFQAGVDAFRLGRHDEARAHLEKARALEPGLAGPVRFLAAVAQAQGRWADCIAATRTALALNPRSSELADTRRLHEACRASAGRAPYRGSLGERAAIAVTANVAGATVRIGGLSYGGTPLAPRPITAGALAVELAKAGFRPARLEIDALPGIVTDVAVELVAEPPPAAPPPPPPPPRAAPSPPPPSSEAAARGSSARF
jgi:hypothetical protein